MIVVQASDPYLRRAVKRLARPEEDVFVADPVALEALEWGFPRLVVRDERHRRAPLGPRVPVVDVDDETVLRWDQERRAEELPPDRVDHLAACLSSLIDRVGSEPTWVDRALADLSRASGRRLPMPLRAFGRRVLEFPSYYTSLHPIADRCGTSRGALKARFRRRDLPSPFIYLRWFRILAAAEVLSDRSVTVAAAASRLGFTSNGNLCRMMRSVCDITPTEARTVRGWNRLLVTFAWRHLSADALDAWVSLEDLFERKAA